MDYSKTPQKYVTNQKTNKSNLEVKVNWLVKMQDLYFSTLVEVF